MSAQTAASAPHAKLILNGAGAAAVLAAGIGAFAVAVFAILADKAALIKRLMDFYAPTGPLSGVSICAIVLWLAVWFILHYRWRQRNISARSNTPALILLFLGLLLTFPPIADLL